MSDKIDLAASAAIESPVANATRGVIFHLPWVETHGYNQRSLCDQVHKNKIVANPQASPA